MGAKPSTVWMIHRRTGRDGHKGHLSLTPEGLRFVAAADEHDATIVPFADMRRVRRTWGSPVLEVALRTPNGLALEVIGFYFTKPPSLEAPSDIHVMKKHRTKTRAVVNLRMANASKRESIAQWVREIEAARGAAQP